MPHQRMGEEGGVFKVEARQGWGGGEWRLQGVEEGGGVGGSKGRGGMVVGLLPASLCQSRLEAGPTCFSLPPRERQSAAATNLPFVFLNIFIAIISLSFLES